MARYQRFFPLIAGLMALYTRWREAKSRKDVDNAPIDAKSKTQPRTTRKSRS